jgi:hypothetical protein
MPSVECIMVGRELGAETDVYINEAPSRKLVKISPRDYLKGTTYA